MTMSRIITLFATIGAMIFSSLADYTRVEWIQGATNGGQWINTKVLPECTDKIEMKVFLTNLGDTQCLYCSRGIETTENTFTCFLLSGCFRFDRKDSTDRSISQKPEKEVEYIITADGKTLEAKYTKVDGTLKGSVTMKEGEFTPGSCLTLFGSHTSGSALNSVSDIGNYGRYRLYYFKVYNKDGTLKCNLVPVRDNSKEEGNYQRYGLFDTIAKRYLPNNRSDNGGFSAGDATEDEVYEEVVIDVGSEEIDVAEGQTRQLTAEEVANLGMKTLIKKGRGTLIAGEEMANFKGDIRIVDGYYDATVANAFGTKEGDTYVEGGTIISHVRATNEWQGDPSCASESFFLNGTGCDNNGVIRCDTSTYNFAGRGVITLLGDILITGNKDIEFRYGGVNMNNHDIYVALNNNSTFRLVATAVQNGGSMIALSGRVGIEGGIAGASDAKSITLKSGTAFTVNDLQKPQQRTLNFENGSKMVFGTSKAALGSAGDFSHFAGPVKLLDEGEPLTIQYDLPGRVLNFSGPISGTRGINGTNGGWLQLLGNSPEMMGTVALTGVPENNGLNTKGGISMVGLANLPREGGGISLTNAQFHSYLDNDITNICMIASQPYPALSVHGIGVITSSTLTASINLKSLKKTGNGELSIFGRCHVDGDTEIEQGSLSFKTAVPTVCAGLNWYFRHDTNISYGNLPTEPAAYHGVDATGCRFAYTFWMPTIGENGSPNHNQTHWYSGFIRIPGEEGTKTVCNFVSSINRIAYVKIGDKIVVDFRDRTDHLTGFVSPNYKRLCVGQKVELDAGWQPLYIVLANSWDGACGPKPDADYGWPENFGLGVDWQGRCETNSLNYAKFIDPGDGSFLRATLSSNCAEVEDSLYRPSFGGAVSFAPGTVLNINDSAPYAPVKIPSLTGVPIVRNGAVAVQSRTWTLRASDIMDETGGPKNAPLTLDETSELSFPEGNIILDVAPQAAKILEQARRSNSYPLISAPEGKIPSNDFVLSEGMRGKGLWVRKTDTSLELLYRPGTILVIR